MSGKTIPAAHTQPAKPKRKERPLTARSIANKAAHAAALEKVRAEARAAKKPIPKLEKPVNHPFKLPKSLQWDRKKVMGFICERLASSTESLTSILEHGANGFTLPAYTNVHYWLTTDKECHALYLQAKEAQADFMAEEMLGIADDGRNDYMERFDKDGTSLGFVLNGEHVQRSRLRIDTRQWLMGKLKPKRYGLKADQQGEEESPDELAEALRRAADFMQKQTSGGT